MKSGYAIQMGSMARVKLAIPSSSYSPFGAMWRKLWTIPTLPKIHMFLWKASRNWIPCKANLVKRKCGSDLTCPICETSSETVEHILFHCPWSRAVWFGSDRRKW